MNRTRHIRTVILAAALLCGGSALAEIEWTLLDRDCGNLDSAFTVHCGEYGTFRFGSTQPPAGCVARTQGREDNPVHYPPPPDLLAFPIQPKRLQVTMLPTQPHPLGTHDTDDEGTGGGGDEPGEDPLDRPTRRMIAIDWDDDHGFSVVELIASIFGPATETLFASLDDPQLDPLGTEVNDFHVLAQLCNVAEGIDRKDEMVPEGVNMSFGRNVVARDADDPAICDESAATCQIARVIDYLRAKDIFFVAAAGNHQTALFPGTLKDVASAAMLSPNPFSTHGEVIAGWESPEDFTALTLGSGLCLGDWAAPSGSSYSAAMFSGWLAFLREEDPGLDPVSPLVWAPRWEPRLGCYVLTHGRRTHGRCNAAIDDYFEGVRGSNSEGCWSARRAEVAAGPPPTDPEAPPASPSYAVWSESTGPAPASDPCVPCEASSNGSGGPGSGNGMTLNMSQSAPMAEGQILDSVMLRVDTDFYPLALTSQQLQDIQHAALPELDLPGWSQLLKIGSQPSFWYQSKTDPAIDCIDVPDECFWSSTPITIPPLP